MAWQFESPKEIVKDCQQELASDQDAMLLFTGEPGAGKSTVAFQFLINIDPSFSAKRIAFTIRDWVALDKRTPRGKANHCDEALVSARKAMYGDNLALIDRLQVNRGMNHASGFCFPYAKRVDEPILDRVRYRIDIPQKGLRYYVVWQREATSTRGRGGMMVEEFRWVERGRFTFGANSGPQWREYLDAKEAHMAAQGEDEEEEEGPPRDPLGDGWGDARDILSAARQNADRAPSGPSV